MEKQCIVCGISFSTPHDFTMCGKCHFATTDKPEPEPTKKPKKIVQPPDPSKTLDKQLETIIELLEQISYNTDARQIKRIADARDSERQDRADTGVWTG